ncbi:MAG: hypothetical protein QOJ62_1986, partial [Actinomycetota bacterium]|nr:hypothetical protein [Actinomycetota bacterium]
MAALPSEVASARAGSYRVSRSLRSVLPSWRKTPFTCVYLALLGVCVAILGLLSPASQAAVLQGSSTDVDNLFRHPIWALVSSALWVDGLVDYLVAAVVLGIVATALERRIGTRWVIGVFATGHVVATLLTEGAIAIGVHAGMLPSASLSRLDVGISYGMAATLAAAAGLLGRRRLLGVVLAWAYLGWPLVASRDMTAWGHVVALAVGVAWWPLLRQRVAQPSTQPATQPAT